MTAIRALPGSRLAEDVQDSEPGNGRSQEQDAGEQGDFEHGEALGESKLAPLQALTASMGGPWSNGSPPTMRRIERST
ncbi:hypothetical protein [Methylobacterium sp.]|uniref:hypothetical protein n=1 Tax=Methylobacterium sp. TaxID=409 RepID=UPI00272A52D1|nr:hypothetical protein [Methylobacterium sp.]